jgi:hypothetical protein
MATANHSSARRRLVPRLLLAGVVVVGAVAWFYREPIAGYTVTGAAFGARTACACRYIGGRALGDCEKDFEPGMGAVFLSEDAESKSVTARVPLLARATARYRDGFGCVLEPWDG